MFAGDIKAVSISISISIVARRKTQGSLPPQATSFFGRMDVYRAGRKGSSVRSSIASQRNIGRAPDEPVLFVEYQTDQINFNTINVILV